MKKLYFLLFTLLITSLSFGQIWTEDFESYTDGTGIEGVDAGGAIVNIGDYPATVTKWTLDPSSAALTASSDWAKTISGVFSFRDVDGPLIWQSESIDISGATSPVTFAVEASNNAGGFESSDFYDVYYSIDGGAFTLVANWNGLGDASHTIIGDMGSGDWATVEMIQVSGLSGNSLQIQVIGTNNSGNEQFFLDNVQVIEGALPPTVSVTAPANNAVFAPGTTTVMVEFTGSNLAGGETYDIDVNGTITTGVTSPFPVTTVDGMTYNVTVNLMDGMTVLDFEGVDFSVASPTNVADLAALRADFVMNGTGAYYVLASTPTVTYTRGNRNQIYIQDASAGILIDDVPNIIATPFVIGDGISGLIGQASEFGGVLQLVPAADASVAAGATIVPEVVLISQLVTANGWENYESELIQIVDGLFADGDGTATFATSTNYDVTDSTSRLGGSGPITFRPFNEADYIGEVIPVGATDITALVAEFGGAAQISSRTLGDVTLSTDQFTSTSFAVYPNPTNTGFVTIKSQSNEVISVVAFDILGKQVINTTISDNTLNVSKLNTGIYILNISQNNNTVTKKLVIN